MEAQETSLSLSPGELHGHSTNTAFLRVSQSWCSESRMPTLTFLVNVTIYNILVTGITGCKGTKFKIFFPNLRKSDLDSTNILLSF